jgi:hypothetical protein
MLQKAIQKANGESGQALRQINKRAMEIDEEDIRPVPLLNGHDLMSLDATPGPMVGQLGQEMYIAQLEGHLKTKTQAKSWCQDWLKQHKSN